MSEKDFAAALSLAKILLATREQFARALRDAAAARLAAPNVDALFRSALDPHVDDAVYAIGRDGAERLEDNVRRVIDDIVREAQAAGEA